jgi:hypothetical protein
MLLSFFFPKKKDTLQIEKEERETAEEEDPTKVHSSPKLKQEDKNEEEQTRL